MKRPLPLLAAALCAALATTPAVAQSPDADALRARLARAEMAAGLTALEGPGLVVTLRDCPLQAPSGVDRKTLLIRDQDLNAVLDALRAGGAEAVAVSGRGSEPERVTMHSAARASASGVSLNGTELSGPYRITAIGDRRAMRAELFRAEGVVHRAGLDALQMIEVQESEKLAVPAARAGAPFRFARAPRQEPEPPPMAAPRSPAASNPGRAVTDVVRRAPESAPTPAPMPAEMRAATPPTPRAAPMAKPAAGAFFGGQGLSKYHTAKCRFGERVEPAQRVHFSTEEEAKRSGRAPCTVCVPNSGP